MSAPLNNKYQPTLAPIQENQVQEPQEKKQAPRRDLLLEIFSLAWNPNLDPQVRARLNAIIRAPASLPQNPPAAAAAKK